MLGTKRTKAVIVGVLLLLLAVIIACGEEATPTATSAPAAPAETAAAPAATDAPATQAPAAAATPGATPATAVVAPQPTDAMMDGKKPEGTFNVGMSGLGPYVATLYDAGYFKNRFAELVTHETLFIMDYEGEWAPRLIESFDISPDGLTYTMHLQEGAKWHAGASAQGDWGAFDADDFIWSIGEIAREGSNHVQAGNTRRVFECDGCSLSKIDDYTVKLTRPAPTFELTWYSQAPIPGFSMNSKKHYDAVGQDVALLEDVGTAPWEMVEHITDDRRVMKAVEDHWRHVPDFAEMVWHDMLEESTRLANFQGGLLDTGIFNSDSVQAMKDSPVEGQSFMVFPGAIVQMLWFGGGHYTPDSPHHQPDANGNIRVRVDEEGTSYEYFCDDGSGEDQRRPWVSCDREVGSVDWERARKVREAMTIGIDRQALINNIAFGEGEPWYIGIWANRGRMEQLGLNDLEWEYNPERAMELLTEAGYPDGFKVPIAKRSGTGTLLLVKDAVAGMWEKVGLQTELRNVQASSYRTISQARKANDIYGLNDAPSFPEPLRVYGTVYSSDTNDMFGVNHPEIDRLIEKIRATLDTDARWGVQGELAEFIFDQVFSMPLYAENAVWPLSGRVGPWKAAPAELDWLSYWDMPPRKN
jgi:peptide/nickel transport system substrate-binding protein